MHPFKRLLVVSLVTALCDGIFATVQSLVVNGSAARVWQGVASVLLGREAIGAGASATAAGVLMHVGVACFWSAVFLVAFATVDAIRSICASRGRSLIVAAIYGPMIWPIMSLGLIPLLVHRPPVINARWWIQLIGHIVFVGVPIVFTTRATAERSDELRHAVAFSVGA